MIKHTVLNPAAVELENLRLKLRNAYQRDCDPAVSEFGDFTYGLPRIMSWGEGSRLKVGKFCSISTDVTILLGGEHNADWGTTYPFNALLPSYHTITGHPKTKGDVIVGNDVWIGDGAKILSGVHIGDGCVVGSSALVTKDMPPYSICGGNPASVIKYRFDNDTIRRMLEIKWWDWSANHLCKAIPLLQSSKIEKLFEFYDTTVLGDKLPGRTE